MKANFVLILVFIVIANCFAQTSKDYSNTGYSKYQKQDYQGAILDFNKALEINPKDTNTYIIRGLAKSSLDDYSGAIADYTKAIEIDPKGEFGTAYVNRALAKFEIKDYRGAIEDYGLAITAGDRSAQTYTWRGESKDALKEYQRAIADYTKAIEINNFDQSSASLYSKRGNSKTGMKDYQGALADYSKAIMWGTDPYTAWEYNSRGKVKEAMDDHEGAMADFKVAIEKYSKLLESNPACHVYSARGDVKVNMQDYQGAIADYSNAIQSTSNYARGYNRRGKAKAKLQDYRGAIADYNKAIEISPNHAEAYTNRGNSKGGLKDYSGALADFNKAIKIDPTFAEAYVGRGLAEIVSGQKDNGCLDLSKAGELGDESAYENIKQYCTNGPKVEQSKPVSSPIATASVALNNVGTQVGQSITGQSSSLSGEYTFKDEKYTLIQTGNDIVINKFDYGLGYQIMWFKGTISGDKIYGTRFNCKFPDPQNLSYFNGAGNLRGACGLCETNSFTAGAYFDIHRNNGYIDLQYYLKMIIVTGHTEGEASGGVYCCTVAPASNYSWIGVLAAKL